MFGMLGRTVRWLLRRERRGSAVERLRLNEQAPVEVHPWEPSEDIVEPDDGPSFHVVSTSPKAANRAGSKPRGLSDDEWRSRTA
jgi:hypothetical protein